MSAFAYKNGELSAEDVALSVIAADVGTPFYCYSTAALRDNYRAFADAFAALDATICYAVKANSNLAVIHTLGGYGAGADVDSEGELRRALAAGIAPERIVFSGVGKTAAEIAFALEAGIFQINVESEAELETINELARGRGRAAPIALRINPDVDAATHAKITTGRRENKFGIPWPQARELYAKAADLPAIDVAGIAVHIGSQVMDLAPFEAAFGLLADAVGELRGAGHDIRRIDLGGGLGIRYRDETPPAPASYAALIERLLAPLGCTVLLEPGRALVGAAGVLVTRITYEKDMADRRVLIVDGAMNDLMRPSMYEAWHTIRPVREAPAGATETPVDIAGPVCESADVFATARPMPPLHTKDLLAIGEAGAYGAVMASNYNSRLLVPEVLVNGSDYAVVRARQSFEDLLARDTIPDWLAAPEADTSRGAA